MQSPDKEATVVGNLLNVDPVTVECVVQQLTNCYIKLGDWESLSSWLEQLKLLRARNPNLVNAFTLPFDVNSLLSWVNFLILLFGDLINILFHVGRVVTGKYSRSL